MLCRTANDLYWTARHIERAENTARMIDIAQRIELLPERTEGGRQEAAAWRRALEALGLAPEYVARHGAVTPARVLRFLCLEPENPSSIYTCVRAARESARAQRGAITVEMYEDINTSWLEMRALGSERFENDGLPRFIEWVKTRSASFRGVTVGTMGRDEGYQFMRLGVFTERADCCVRMLDIKYSEPLTGEAGDARKALGYYQWSALLYAMSAFETYRRLYRTAITPERVAELMILREDLPRSLAACTSAIHGVLQNLSGQPKSEVVRLAGILAAETRYGRIDAILAEGMDVYLERFMGRLFALAAEVDRHFLIATDVDASATAAA
jgi:uncharacterized alpha-E superfamily protein